MSNLTISTNLIYAFLYWVKKMIKKNRSQHSRVHSISHYKLISTPRVFKLCSKHSIFVPGFFHFCSWFWKETYNYQPPLNETQILIIVHNSELKCDFSHSFLKVCTIWLILNNKYYFLLNKVEIPLWIIF